MVINSPRHQHICMVVVKSPEFCKTSQETCKVLRVVCVIKFAEFLQNFKQWLLKSFHRFSVLYILPVCFIFQRTGKKIMNVILNVQVENLTTFQLQVRLCDFSLHMLHYSHVQNCGINVSIYKTCCDVLWKTTSCFPICFNENHETHML